MNRELREGASCVTCLVLKNHFNDSGCQVEGFEFADGVMLCLGIPAKPLPSLQRVAKRSRRIQALHGSCGIKQDDKRWVTE
ncbi:MAG: hypothetical protein LBE22_03875 [Azoarcus sp.]|nr:hypothetical protein [Azoarcus sp.]